MPKVIDDTPPILKAYEFHGLELTVKGKEAIGDCPFCDKEEKFSVAIETGECRCFSCAFGSLKGGTNVYGFLREVWEQSSNLGIEAFANQRKVLTSKSLDSWGLRRCCISQDWIHPGYNVEGAINQLYRWTPLKVKEVWKHRWLPTPGLDPNKERHGILGFNLWDENKPKVYLCEGWGDGVALWEMLSLTQSNSLGQLTPCKIPALSLLKDANVIATPGCLILPDNWLPLFKGKEVYLPFDNDYPNVDEKQVQRGLQGYRGVKRIAQILGSLEKDKQPSATYFVQWGDRIEEGYTASLPDGYDVRDALSASKQIHMRIGALDRLLKKFVPTVPSWLTEEGAATAKTSVPKEMTSLACSDWSEVQDTWNIALHWREDLDIVLACMLAVAISTDAKGSQLFLRAIGDPGSAKTRLAEAMLVSKHCYPFEHITGLFSGWNDGTGKDMSRLLRMNHKVNITPEGDVMMSNPKFDQIMSELRRAFDGSSSTSFKNRADDQIYSGLRIPWILVGTWELLKKDQSKVGDRFLQVCIGSPNYDERRAIVRRAIYNSIDATLQRSNGTAESSLDPKMAKAYRKTGGYVDYLFAKAEQIMSSLRLDREELADRCEDLGELTALLRAKPDTPKRGEASKNLPSTTELPTRVGEQYSKLSICLAAVMGKSTIDEEVYSRVRKVAIDTSIGTSLEMVRSLHRQWNKERRGILLKGLATTTNLTDEQCGAWIYFLKKVGVVEGRAEHLAGIKLETRYQLTSRMRLLWDRIADR